MLFTYNNNIILLGIKLFILLIIFSTYSQYDRDTSDFSYYSCVIYHCSFAILICNE